MTPPTGNVVSAEASSTIDADATYTIEPGVDSDAVLLGFSCALPLDRDGETLLLQRSVECIEDAEQGFDFAGEESETSSKRTTTFVDVSVRDMRDGRIALDALADMREQSRDAEGTKTSLEGELSFAFDGVLVSR